MDKTPALEKWRRPSVLGARVLSCSSAAHQRTSAPAHQRTRAPDCVTVCHMTRRNTSSSPLTPLQQAILKFIESKGPVTADQVREGVMRDHPLKDSSVRTLLRRLEARGLVSHTVDGKTFLYRADVASTSVAAAAVRRLIDGFWKGSAEQFLTGLVDEKVLSAADLRRLAKKVGGRK